MAGSEPEKTVVSKDSRNERKSTFNANFANLPSRDRPGDVLAEAGIQIGATKIFLRQFAFDNIEKLRNQILSASAVKTQQAARRFIFRCRYIRRLECVVILQACARRFLARKSFIIFRQRKNATIIQMMVRSSLARRRFKAIQTVCIVSQTIARAYLARKTYKVLHAEVIKQRKLNNAATTKSSKKSPKKAAKKKVEGKALKVATKADKATAIEKDQKNEVKSLTTQVGNANHAAEKAKETDMELGSVKAELEAALAELATVKEELSKKSKRVDVLEQENAELQEKLQSGAFVSGEPYNIKMYADHPDLEELDKGLYTLKAQSKKGKEDLKLLLESISLLK
jgi:myosin heavy subunit